MLLLLGLVILFAVSNVAAQEELEEKVHLSVPYSMNFIIDFQYCKAEEELLNKKVIVLNDLVVAEEEKVVNLITQNTRCTENYNIKKKQAEEWKEEYLKTSEELTKALEVPFYKQWYFVLMVGILTGGIIP